MRAFDTNTLQGEICSIFLPDIIREIAYSGYDGIVNSQSRFRTFLSREGIEDLGMQGICLGLLKPVMMVD